MLGINVFREKKGGRPDLIRQSEERRGRDPSIVDKVIQLDNEWVALQFAIDQQRKKIHELTRQVKDAKKDQDKFDALRSEISDNKKKLAAKQEECESTLTARNTMMRKIGNILLADVPVSNDEEDNEVYTTYGTIRYQKLDPANNVYSHDQIMHKLGGLELDNANKIAGHRAYYLIGDLARLSQALYLYAQNFLVQRGYTLIQTPMFIRQSYMAKAAELADFEETLYKIPMKDTDKEIQKEHENDLYLIATSEQPLCCLHANQYFSGKELPIRYAGYSTCFRKEAGSHGKDMHGIFRVHQFEKVEQFIICDPSESEKHQKDMLAICEEFYQSLELPYRIVKIVSGALNDAAARKCDLEAWFPSHADYRELVSCSNCTDYQARDLDIKIGFKSSQNAAQQFAHTLNGTMCAVQRTLCCLVENYQVADGVCIPKVLQPYMGGLEKIKYREEAEKV